MDVGIRRWPDLKSTFLLRDAFFPVCSPALLTALRDIDIFFARGVLVKDAAGGHQN